MPAFTGRIKTGYENIQYLKTGGAVAYPETVHTVAPLYQKDLTAGTGAGQANSYYLEERTITSGGSFALDLVGSTSQDIAGNNLAMTQLVALHVIAAPADGSAAANTTNITITTTLAGIFGGTTPSVIMAPGESFQRANTGTNGLCAVTATTADTITFTNSAGASAKVQILAIGRA